MIALKRLAKGFYYDTIRKFRLHERRNRLCQWLAYGQTLFDAERCVDCGKTINGEAWIINWGYCEPCFMKDIPCVS